MVDGADSPVTPSAAVGIAAYLPLVAAVARSLRTPPSVDIGDLRQAGTLGLLFAAQRFDPAAGVTFKTFAQFRIRGAMQDYLRRLDWCPRPVQRLIAADLRGDVEGREATVAQFHAHRRHVESLDWLDDEPWLSDDADPADRAIARVDVARALAALHPARSAVIARRVWCDQERLAVVAAEFGVSESRISQILSVAKGRLRILLAAS